MKARLHQLKRYFYQSRSIGQIVYLIFKPIFFIILPFWLLIRGSVYFYQGLELNTWIALLLGIISTVILLLLYIAFFYRKILKKYVSLQTFKNRAYLTLAVLIGYCVFALQPFFMNAQKAEVQDEYTSLHPFLRLGVRTLLLIDSDLLITDAKRFPEDYNKMGLPTKKHSLHYIQSTGYAHAMDIRVNGRYEIRNRLVQLYFYMFGFNTIRHVGTADHLHISLSLPEFPYRK